MGGRNHDTAYRGSITAMRVRIENQVGHPRSQPGIDRLLQAGFVKRFTNGGGSNHGDRLGLGTRGEHGGRFGRGNHFKQHRISL